MDSGGSDPDTYLAEAPKGTIKQDLLLTLKHAQAHAHTTWTPYQELVRVGPTSLTHKDACLPVQLHVVR